MFAATVLPNPTPTLFEIDTATAVLKGVRYANPGKKPILLVHGIQSSTVYFKFLGRELHKMGYDVWMINLRGHGMGAHKSKLKGKLKKVRLQDMIVEDIPETVRYIANATRQKVNIVGYSMGSMVTRAYTAGVREGAHGALVFDDALALKRAQTLVASRISVGGPPHFRNLPDSIKQTARIGKKLSQLGSFDLPTIGPTHTPTDITTLKLRDRLKIFAWTKASEHIENLIPPWLYVPKNMTPGEKKRIIESTSNLNTSLGGEFADFVLDENYVIGGLDMTRAPQHVRTRTFLIAGEKDGLARAPDVLEEMTHYHPDAEARFLLFEDVAHVEMATGKKAAGSLSDIIGRYIRRPSSVGAVGARLKVRTCNMGYILRNLTEFGVGN